jgi:hypothetical protein
VRVDLKEERKERFLELEKEKKGWKEKVKSEKQHKNRVTCREHTKENPLFISKKSYRRLKLL